MVSYWGYEDSEEGAHTGNRRISFRFRFKEAYIHVKSGAII